MKRAVFLALLFLAFHWFQPGPYYLQKGNSHYRRGNYRKALLFYRRAQEHGIFAEADFNMGCAFYMLGKYKEAGERFKKYISLRGDDYRGYFNLGNAYFRGGDYRGAYEMFKQALKRRPDFYPAKVNLELSLRKMQEASSSSASSRPLPDAIMEYLKEKEKEVFRKRWHSKGSSGERDW